NGHQSTVLADVNHDGNLDLVLNDPSFQRVAVLLGNGDGTFRAPIYSAVGLPESVAVADLDQDGNLDLVVQNGAVSILSGNGDGTFRSPVRYDIAAAQRQLQIADFNGDGFPDVAVLVYVGGSLDVFLNAGRGRGGGGQPGPGS